MATDHAVTFVDTPSVLQDDFAEMRFGPSLDNSTGLALGFGATFSAWRPGYDQDYEAGFTAGRAFERAKEDYLSRVAAGDSNSLTFPDAADYGAPRAWPCGAAHADGWLDALHDQWGRRRERPARTDPAAVAGFDLDSAAPRWQIDLTDAAPLRHGEAVSDIYADADGHGHAVVRTRQAHHSEQAVMVIDHDGSVVSAARINGRVGHVADGLMVTHEDNATQVVAYRTEDITKPLWRSAANESRVLAHEASGAFWVNTDAGFVDAATGRPVGFGGGEAANSYAVMPRTPDPVLLRFDRSDSRIARIVPASGEEVWVAELPAPGRGRSCQHTPTVLVVEDHDRGDLFSTVAIDLETGKELWTGNRTRLGWFRGYWRSSPQAASAVIGLAVQGTAPVAAPRSTKRTPARGGRAQGPRPAVLAHSDHRLTRPSWAGQDRSQPFVASAVLPMANWGAE